MLGECRYHNPEQEELCIHTGRPCFGAEFDEFNQKWVVEKWKEKSCPNFEAREQSVWKIDYRKAFAGELDDAEEATQAEITIFGNLIPYNCEEDGVCDLPESIDLDAEVLQNFMDKKYGKGRIKVTWIDIMSDDVEKYPEVKEQLEKSGPTTMVTINRRLRFVGSIPVELIKRELEKMGIHELKRGEREE